MVIVVKMMDRKLKSQMTKCNTCTPVSMCHMIKVVYIRTRP